MNPTTINPTSQRSTREYAELPDGTGPVGDGGCIEFGSVGDPGVDRPTNGHPGSCTPELPRLARTPRAHRTGGHRTKWLHLLVLISDRPDVGTDHLGDYETALPWPLALGASPRILPTEGGASSSGVRVNFLEFEMPQVNNGGLSEVAQFPIGTHELWQSQAAITW